ncbi:MAG: hypothetical protein ACREL7_02910 [Longimicrobiales bacterium]
MIDEQINTKLCVQQPVLSSAEAARGWLDDHPGGRVFPVEELPLHAWVAHMRDEWRPRILSNAA